MTPQQNEALKLALEALKANYLLVNGTETHGGLEQCLDGYYSSCFDTDPINKQTEEAITALEEVLKEHAMRETQRLGQEIEQAPVAKYSDIVSDGGLDPRNTTPPQRKPLTDKAITQVIDSMPKKMKGFMVDWDLYEFARAIEAKPKENT